MSTSRITLTGAAGGFVVLEVCALSCDFPAFNPLVYCMSPGIADRIMINLNLLHNCKETSLSNGSSHNDLLLGIVEPIDLYRTGAGISA